MVGQSWDRLESARSDEYRWRIFVYHQLLDIDTALEYAEYINNYSYSIEEDNQTSYLFPIFEFDGEYLAIESVCNVTNISPIFHIPLHDELALAFTSLTSMMLTLAECYETGVYVVTSKGKLEVVNKVKFAEIRRKYNPGAVHSLYAEGW